MLSLSLAAGLFAAIHLLISGTRLRDRLVQRLGERVYMGLFSAVSAVVLAWLIMAYSGVRVAQVTALHEWRPLAAVLMFIAFVFIVLGLLTPSPTVVGGDRLLAQEDGARGIQRVTRHPFLWGVALWAATHLAFNPALPHVLFFGAFLVVALPGTVSIDAKRARRHGELWQRFAARTSNVPFAAIVSGRNQLRVSELALPKLAAALAAYLGFALLHLRFFGVAPY